jgi:hypothetical protein
VTLIRKFWHPCPAPGPRDTLQRSQARSQGSVASTVGRVQRFNDAIAQRSSPGLASNRSTVKPLSRCTTPASRCKPSHPSPSAHQFRLPFNWLAPSELRRIFCSDEDAGAAIDLMARRDPIGIRLLTRNGHDWSPRYPLIVEAVNQLKVRSCLIEGEAVVCDDDGRAVWGGI